MASMSRPALDPPTLPDNSGPFMRAPREIRDNIYRFLLLTKHTRQICPASGRYPTSHKSYRFHTSIMFTSRQIYHEASDVFYMENLFIRVNCVMPEPYSEPDPSGSCRDYGYAPPISSNTSKVQACTHHVMELDLISGFFSDGRATNYHYILACDDLPRIYWHLLWMDGYYGLSQIGFLVRELWITIGDEVSTTGMRSVVVVKKSTGNVAATCLNAASKNAAANGLKSTLRSKVAVKRNAAIHKETDIRRNTTIHGTTKAKSGLSESTRHIDSPRLQRLLEPLRALYNIGTSYIDAPISEQYRQEIQTSLFRARPSIHDLFPMFVSAYEEAVTTFSAGYFVLAIQKMIGTLDIVDIMTELIEGDALAKVATEPFAGVSFKEALFGMQYTIMNNLIQAYLQIPKDLQNLQSAQALARTVIETYIHDDAWDQSAHNNAMAHYRQAEVWAALDELGAHKLRPRSEVLGAVIDMLKAALQYEPDNPMLQQELERRRKEKETARIIEEVREMERAEGAIQSRERSGWPAGPMSAARRAELRGAS